MIRLLLDRNRECVERQRLDDGTFVWLLWPRVCKHSRSCKLSGQHPRSALVFRIPSCDVCEQQLLISMRLDWLYFLYRDENECEDLRNKSNSCDRCGCMLAQIAESVQELCRRLRLARKRILQESLLSLLWRQRFRIDLTWRNQLTTLAWAGCSGDTLSSSLACLWRPPIRMTDSAERNCFYYVDCYL